MYRYLLRYMPLDFYNHPTFPNSPLIHDSAQTIPLFEKIFVDVGKCFYYCIVV